MRPNPATLLLSSLLILAPAGPVFAEDPGAEATELQQLAQESYDLGEYGDAKTQLESALVKLGEAGKSRTGDAARAHVFLGVVSGAGLDDPDAAIEHFMEGLKIDPDVTIAPEHSTEKLAALFAKAKLKLSPTCGSFQGLHHQSVTEATAGAPVTVECMVGTAIDGARVELYLQPEGSSEFRKVEMSSAGECGRVATIPAELVAGEQIRYYLNALTKEGKVVAAAGRASSPFVIEISRAVTTGGGAGGEGGDSGSGAEEVPEHLRAGKTQKRGGCAGCTSSGPAGAGGLVLLGCLAAAVLVRRRSGSC